MRVHPLVRRALPLAALVVSSIAFPSFASASEADLIIPAQMKGPDAVKFLGGVDGHTLLLVGMVIPLLGLLFGLVIAAQLKKMPVHRTMLEVSTLIYATCKTYLITQGKFLMGLWVLMTFAVVTYFGFLAEYTPAGSTTAVHGFPGGQRGDDRRVQPHRHGRFGCRRVVRHSCEHVCEQPNGARIAQRLRLPVLRHPAEGRHVDRHGADQCRAVFDALHPALRSREPGRALLHRFSRSANRSARRRYASRAASSRRSPISDRI